MMVGDPALNVFAEGVIKGFRFKNLEKLYGLLYQGATVDTDEVRRPGNSSYRKFGYIPHKTAGVWGAVSTTLEYAYQDWSLARLPEH
jgi:putative alpha-1,2-mannosidase